MRERLLRIILGYKSVNICNHKFPLPPLVDDERLAKLNTCKHVQNELVIAVEVEDKERGAQLEKIKLLEAKIRKTSDDLAIKSQELLTMRGIHKTESNYKRGDELLHFGRFKGETLSVPIIDYELKENSWNCHLKKQVFDAQKCILKFDIVPNFLNLLKKEIQGNDAQRWFSIVWAEFSGEKAYPDEVVRLQNEEAAITVELNLLQRNHDIQQKAHGALDEKLNKHKERQNEIHQMMEVLNHDVFDLTQVDEVVAFIKKPFS